MKIDLNEMESMIAGNFGVATSPATVEPVVEQEKKAEVKAEAKEVKEEPKVVAQKEQEVDVSQIAAKKKALDAEVDALSQSNSENAKAILDAKKAEAEKLQSVIESEEKVNQDVDALEKVTAVLPKEKQEALEPFLIQAITASGNSLDGLSSVERALKLVSMANELMNLGSDAKKPKDDAKINLRNHVQQDSGVDNAGVPSTDLQARLNSSDPNVQMDAFRDMLWADFNEALSEEGKRHLNIR